MSMYIHAELAWLCSVRLGSGTLEATQSVFKACESRCMQECTGMHSPLSSYSISDLKWSRFSFLCHSMGE